MIVFSLFFFGFFFSFVGSISPSMLTLFTLKISLEKGQKAVHKYALGVSLIVFPQVIIAVILTKHIAENPTIIKFLEKLGIVIFLLLSIYFYKESKKIKVETIKVKKENPFLTGILLSSLNLFSIPFYCGVATILETLNLFVFSTVPVLFFTFGSVLGTFYILFLYGKFATIIQQKTGKLTKNINIILSILTGLVALISIVKLFFNS